MTLLEVAIITCTSFNETHLKYGSWVFNLYNVVIKNHHLLSSSFGRGKTLAAAKKDYAKQLQNRLIVVNAGKPDRHEYLLPPKITSR